MTPRIAVVFPLPLRREHVGKDVLLIPEGLRRLGFEVELHCPVAEGEDWPVPVVQAGAGGLERTTHWRGRGISGAVVFSFVGHARIIEALRSAGARVVAKGDTDGLVIARVHPRATLVYAFFDSTRLGRRALSLGYWLARIGPLHRREARELARALSAAERTVVETDPAIEAVQRVLVRTGASHLADRVSVIPSPVADPFVAGDVTGARERVLVAVGRWQLMQKDAPLLAAALDRFLRGRPDHRAVVIGAGGDRVFVGLAGGRVEYAGRIPQERMVPLLGSARIVVSSSRWESSALASQEGLAMGCSVAGPDLAPIRNAAELGPFGTVARRRDAEALAAAFAAEAAAWEEGARDPVATAAFWRRRLAVESVAQRYAALLNHPERAGSSSVRS